MVERCPKYWINKYPTPEAWAKATGALNAPSDEDLWRETFQELEYLRKIAQRTIEEGELQLVTPEEDEIKKLWRDWWRYNNPTEYDYHEDNVKKYVKENYNFLAKFYPPPIINAIDHWYYLWDFLKVRNDFPITEEDYQIYFSLLRIKDKEYPFRGREGFVPAINKFYFVRYWSRRITRDVKSLLLKKLLSDPQILTNCAKGNYQLPPRTYPLENRDLYVAYTNRILKEKDEEVKRAQERGRRHRFQQLKPLFEMMNQAQKEGKEVVLLVEKK
jgi:hypothetical protein